MPAELMVLHWCKKSLKKDCHEKKKKKIFFFYLIAQTRSSKPCKIVLHCKIINKTQT